MTDKPPCGDEMAKCVGKMEARKIRAQKTTVKNIWFGLGMMGLVGWSVVVPTLLGAWLGHWLDKNYSGKHSWTISLLIIGIFVGCLNAWHWVSREDKAMRDEEDGK